MTSPPVASLAELREVRGRGGSELVAELGCGEQRQERFPCRQRNIILAYSLVQFRRVVLRIVRYYGSQAGKVLGRPVPPITPFSFIWRIPIGTGSDSAE